MCLDYVMRLKTEDFLRAQVKDASVHVWTRHPSTVLVNRQKLRNRRYPHTFRIRQDKERKAIALLALVSKSPIDQTMDDQPGNVAGRIGFLDKTKFDDVHDASGKPTEVEPPEGSHVEDDCLKLSALGRSRFIQFRDTESLSDLEESIGFFTRALASTPNGHPDISHRHAELGVSYGDRYRRLGMLTDLEKAIEYHTRALRLTPDSHPDLSRRHANLG
ncbi:unnamed protein product [Rhizoctonia solani]|nr:unnamed protein product [Rhizoctonia solani]